MNINVCYLLAFVIGAGLSVQIGLNSQLRVGLGSPVMAALASFVVGIVVLFTLAFVFQRQQSMDALAAVKNIPWYNWMGGFLGAFYVAGVVFIAPRIGVANTTALVVAGQLLVALVLDHFGVLGFMQQTLTLMRALGVCVLVIGVMLILRN